MLLIADKNAHAYNNRGNVYGKTGQYDLALKDYDSAIKHDPSHVKAINNRGTIYRVKGQGDLALRDFDRAIEIDPKYAFCYFNRSLVYQSLGEFKKSLDDANKAKLFGYEVQQGYLELLKSKVN